ncbi:MAG: hypothetical protein QXS85_06310 [Acidilobaceae archaeon]
MGVEEFKTLGLARLEELRKSLKQRYPDRADRVDYIVDLLAVKLMFLSDIHGLSDYVFTVHLASREFEEFVELLPSEDELRELLYFIRMGSI